MKDTDYRDGEWHFWTGGQCPVDKGDRVQVLFRRGNTNSVLDAGSWRWEHDQDYEGNIVAFRVIKTRRDLRQVIIEAAANCMAISAVNRKRSCEELAADLYDAGYLKNPHDD